MQGRGAARRIRAGTWEREPWEAEEPLTLDLLGVCAE